MTDRPILFSAPMVRALLAGLKTQTRRTMKPQPIFYPEGEGFPIGNDRRTSVEWKGTHCAPENLALLAPYGKVGDRLWVKETFKPHSTFAHLKPSEIPDSKIFYRADNSYAPSNTKWWPSLFMQQRFSRILLEIVSIRVERLANCSAEDALAEGVVEYPCLGPQRGPNATYFSAAGPVPGEMPIARTTPVDAYKALWQEINGEDSWDANPFVWVVEFKRVLP